MPIEYALKCPVCREDLEVRLARGRKSGKAFLMALCPKDGRHIRAFINDQEYVRRVLARLEGQAPTFGIEANADITPTPVRRSRTELERENKA